MIDALPNGGTWIELGSWLGKSITYCYEMSAIKQKKFNFHCCDTWLGSFEHTNEEDKNLIQEHKVYEEFLKNVEPIINDINLLRGNSWEQSQHFQDNSCDFVYVDASHMYQDVKKDIASWWPKVKPGGYMGGDDYRKTFPGVKQAVREFVTQYNIPFTKIGRCWLVKK